MILKIVNRPLIYLLLLFLFMSSCVNEKILEIDFIPLSPFPMTAMINGELYEMYNPNGTDEATRSVFTFYPNQEYIQLQGAQISANNLLEVGIDIWIHRNNLQVGTYEVGVGTFGTATHIDLIDTRSAETENTISGSITITDIDVDDKIIKGTFEFNTADISDITAPVNATVTEGTFHYRYDVN